MDAGNLISGLQREAFVLTKLPKLDLSQDPEDNPVLAMAMAGEADYLISGDRRGLLAHKKIGSARIVNAREFLKVLQKRKR